MLAFQDSCVASGGFESAVALLAGAKLAMRALNQPFILSVTSNMECKERFAEFKNGQLCWTVSTTVYVYY